MKTIATLALLLATAGNAQSNPRIYLTGTLPTVSVDGEGHRTGATYNDRSNPDEREAARALKNCGMDIVISADQADYIYIVPEDAGQGVLEDLKGNVIYNKKDFWNPMHLGKDLCKDWPSIKR